MKEAALLLTLRAKEIAQQFGFEALSREVEVLWNSRMRSTAGRAFLGGTNPRIELNARLNEFGENEIERTFLHEMAHLIAFARFGKRGGAGHGRAWQQACAELGIAGEPRCHQLPLPSSKMTPNFIYRCPHCKQSFYRVRKMKKKAACSACCKRFHGGRYSAKFRFEEQKLDSFAQKMIQSSRELMRKFFAGEKIES